MVDLAIETTEPDPSVNSIGDDQTINTSKDGAMSEALQETCGMSPVFQSLQLL